MSVVILGGNECMERRYKELCGAYRCQAKVLTKPAGGLKNKLGLPDLTVFSSSDYFPLLPWVFLYWVGYFFARWFRARCTAQPGLPPKALRPLCAVGSRTLLIYMLHQPVIYGALLGLHALGLA